MLCLLVLNWLSGVALQRRVGIDLDGSEIEVWLFMHRSLFYEMYDMARAVAAANCVLGTLFSC